MVTSTGKNHQGTTIASSPISVVVQAPTNEHELEGISLLKDTTWKCPASAKSLRTVNPIRAIVDPIVANMRSGDERGDGKDLISLAVSEETCLNHGISGFVPALLRIL